MYQVHMAHYTGSSEGKCGHDLKIVRKITNYEELQSYWSPSPLLPKSEPEVIQVTVKTRLSSGMLRRVDR